MKTIEKHMIAAIVISATIVILNIIAVTQNSGVSYYSVIKQFVSRIIS